MSSLRMTFSLTSLFLIFALAFVAMPAMAHDSTSHGTGGVDVGHPTVTISEASYPTDAKKSRTNYRVMVVATVGGSSDSNRFDTADNDLSGVVVRPFTGDGTPLNALTLTPAKTANKHEWLLTIDLSTVPTARSIEVTVPADEVNGNRAGALGGNESISRPFDNLSPVLAYSADLEIAQKKGANNANIPGRYTVTLTFKKAGKKLVTADDDVNPQPSISDIRIMPMGSASAVDATGTAVTDTSATMSGDADTGIYTQDYQLTFGVTDTTFALISGYATNTPSVSIDLDAEPTVDKEEVKPTVDVTLVSHDDEAKSFKVLFSYMKATVDAATETALAVPTELMADGVAVTKPGTGTTMVDAVIPDPEVSSLRGDGQFVVTIDYSLETDGLPLYVTVADASTVSMINGMAADGTPTPALMVGTAPDTTAPTVTHDAPTDAITAATTVTLTFSESVSDVTVTGNPTGDTAKYMSAVAGTGMTRTVTITPTAEADLTADVAETAVTFTVTGQDAADNAIAADTTFEVTLAARAAPTAPAAPTGVTATVNQATDTITVRWMAPADDGGSPITDYRVNVPGDTSYVLGQPRTSTSFRFSPGTYSFTVQAKNRIGYSVASESVSATIDMDPDGTPADETDPVVNVVPVSGAHDAAFDVNFTVVEANPAAQNPVSVTIDPSAAAAAGEPMQTPGSNTWMVTVTPTAATATNPSIAASTITITVTATDASGNTGNDDIAVNLAARVYTPPAIPDTTDPVVSIVENISGTQSAAFDVTFTVVEANPAATNPVAVTIAPTAAATAGMPMNTAGSDTWMVKVTPTAATAANPSIAASTITITVTATDASGNTGNDSIAVDLAARTYNTPPPTPGTRIPGAVDFTSATAAGKTTIMVTETIPLPANGFGVIQTYHAASSLPDIHRFFSEGGTISVLSSDTTAKSKDVVISEIMWGVNERAIGDERTKHQFIELYDTTGSGANLTKISLVFDPANTVPEATDGKIGGMVVLDQVSNVQDSGWLITAAPGQSGRIATQHDTTAFVAANLISMYRKIVYAKVEKTDHDADAAKNREAQLKDFPKGNELGGWASSNTVEAYGVNLIGSPGKKHFVPYELPTATSVKRDMFIINEIGNNTGDKYDWIEIKRVGTQANLKKWRLSQVTDDKKDTALVTFPDNDNHQIPNNGDVLLIVNSDPYQDPDHPLAAGDRINGGHIEKTGIKSRYYVDSGLKLKDSGKTLLILRDSNNNDHLGKTNNIQDVVGTLGIADNSASLRTKMWPLAVSGAPHDDVVKDADEDLRAGKVYTRNASGGTGKHHIFVAGYTGVGYKRSAANNGRNGGTPGYDNGAVKVNEKELAGGATVTISEIMYTKDRNLPQWIELYNSSMSQAVNLNEWKLKIEHSRDVTDVDIRFPTVTTNNLGGNITIQPNQTVLIVSSTTGRNSRASQGNIDFPASRVIDLWGQKDRLEIRSSETRRTYKLLSEKAFRITLMDKSGDEIDVAGNLDTDGTVLWELPTNGNSEGRSSIIRRYNEGDNIRGGEGMAQPGTNPVWLGAGGMGDGMKGDAGWIYASVSDLGEVRANETYYGSPDDIGTPGYRGGGPLPVSLSSFRPERMKDTGEIVVRWITESELNNAGFNILRSEKRDSGFTKVHFRAGQGTTSERTAYEWKDTSAKPNVVYYYQIQDISLDGEVTTLRVTHLRGNVTATGKATTTWGKIKALQ